MLNLLHALGMLMAFLSARRHRMTELVEVQWDPADQVSMIQSIKGPVGYNLQHAEETTWSVTVGALRTSRGPNQEEREIVGRHRDPVVAIYHHEDRPWARSRTQGIGSRKA